MERGLEDRKKEVECAGKAHISGSAQSMPSYILTCTRLNREKRFDVAEHVLCNFCGKNLQLFALCRSCEGMQISGTVKMILTQKNKF